nr:MFS transporter [Acanthopleuribacter pedis]
MGWISFFTDLSSEMIYPLLPLFITGVIGAGTIGLGVMEGLAEATAALVKLFSGHLTDKTGKRKPFIVTGYGIAGLVRPLIGVAFSLPFVILLRFLDRVGKGIRSSPRDALIADVTPPAQLGAAYGFHRAMDHGGSVLGPLVAGALLSGFGFSLRQVFLFAVLPAAVVMVIAVFGVAERPHAKIKQPPRLRGAWSGFAPRFRWFLAAMGLFSLGNASDAFLLLALAEANVPAAWIAVLWAAHNALKMVVSAWSGRLSDRIGRLRLIVWGWLLFGAVYLAFGWVDDLLPMCSLFIGYGVVFGLTEPCQKALVADFCEPHTRGVHFGFFNAVIGLAALPASFLFGFLWYALGKEVAFGVGALTAWCAVALCLWRLPFDGYNEALS